MHLSSTLKIQNFFIKMWFLSTRGTHIAIPSCLLQTIAVSLPPLCQKHILKIFHLPGFFFRTEEGRRASWHAQQWQSQLLTTLRNVTKQEQGDGILQTWCCSHPSAGIALLNFLKFAPNAYRSFGLNKGFIEKRLVLDLVINFSPFFNFFFQQTRQIPWNHFFHNPERNFCDCGIDKPSVNSAVLLLWYCGSERVSCTERQNSSLNGLCSLPLDIWNCLMIPFVHPQE